MPGSLRQALVSPCLAGPRPQLRLLLLAVVLLGCSHRPGSEPTAVAAVDSRTDVDPLANEREALQPDSENLAGYDEDILELRRDVIEWGISDFELRIATEPALEEFIDTEVGLLSSSRQTVLPREQKLFMLDAYLANSTEVALSAAIVRDQAAIEEFERIEEIQPIFRGATSRRHMRRALSVHVERNYRGLDEAQFARIRAASQKMLESVADKLAREGNTAVFGNSDKRSKIKSRTQEVLLSEYRLLLERVLPPPPRLAGQPLSRTKTTAKLGFEHDLLLADLKEYETRLRAERNTLALARSTLRANFTYERVRNWVESFYGLLARPGQLKAWLAGEDSDERLQVSFARMVLSPAEWEEIQDVLSDRLSRDIRGGLLEFFASCETDRFTEGKAKRQVYRRGRSRAVLPDPRYNEALIAADVVNAADIALIPVTGGLSLMASAAVEAATEYELVSYSGAMRDELFAAWVKLIFEQGGLLDRQREIIGSRFEEVREMIKG